MLKCGLVVCLIELVVLVITAIGTFATGQVFVLLQSVFRMLFLVALCFLFLTGIDYVNHRPRR